MFIKRKSNLSHLKLETKIHDLETSVHGGLQHGRKINIEIEVYQTLLVTNQKSWKKQQLKF